MTIKIKLKTKNRSHRYDINRPWPRHGHTNILSIKRVSV